MLLFNTQNISLFFTIIFAVVISSIFIILSYFLIVRSNSVEKISAYECGFQPFEDSRIPFDIHFYMVAILFLIFDLEILFLVPWAVSIEFVGFFGYNVMFIFFSILTLGFVYEWKRGALIW